MTTKEKLIEKWYKGACSREELEKLLDMIRQDPEEDYSEILEQLWQQLQSYPEIEEPMASELVQKTLAKIEEKESGRPLQVINKKKKQLGAYRRRRFMQIASAAAVLFLASAFSWYWLKTDQKIIVHTGFAEQKTIELPDQSTVKLNANSSLSFHKNWNTVDIRQVWLEGEAYFEVKKNEKTGQKFQVVTNDLTVEVLGTVFNVNARQTSTKVYLEEGKVNLNLKEQEDDIEMEPGDLVTYSKLSRKPLIKRIEKEAPASWKDGTALMEDAPLREIVRRIHELYDVRVVVKNKGQLERAFSIGIPVNDPETGYLLLTELTGLEIEKTGKQWTIK